MPEPNVALKEESPRSDSRELVRGTIEDTLDGLLEGEADGLVAAMLKAIHAMGSRGAFEAKTLAVADKLESMGLGRRQGRTQRVRRDLDVHALPSRALEEDSHQQLHREA